MQYCSCLCETLQPDLAGLIIELPVVHRRLFFGDQQKLRLRGSRLWGDGFRTHVISINMGCDTMIPMTLRDTLQTDLVAAMKAADEVNKTTLRAVITAVKTAEAAQGVDGELDDAAIMKLIATEIKQRNEAAEIFTEAGEAERAAKEIAERDVLQAYLPDPLSAEELDALVSAVISEGGYNTKKDMGSAIKDVMNRAGGRVDGKTVSGAVGKALS